MCRAGEIVLLPFPFSDVDSSKRRPAGRMTIEHGKESGGLQESHSVVGLDREIDALSKGIDFSSGVWVL